MPKSRKAEGQPFIIINLNRQEYLDPLHWGHGATLNEIANARHGVMRALAYLTAVGGHLGAGGIPTNCPWFGAWAFNTVALVGPLFDLGGGYIPYANAKEAYRDVSHQVMSAINDAIIRPTLTADAAAVVLGVHNIRR